ncbi:MAG: PP2C family serine/threonine-protein phosphatase [Candidatus Xenobiia bacterium LiM19]
MVPFKSSVTETASKHPSPPPRLSFWRSVAAAVKGRSHESNGKVCQDRVWTFSRHPLHVIALADGAGSCPLSHEGAETATKATARFFQKHISEMLSQSPETIREHLLRYLIRELKSHARKLNVDFKALSCTLLFVAVYNEEFISGHMGDGTIAAMQGGRLITLSRPESGEYVNETFFLTSSSAAARFRIKKDTVHDMEGFMLMSDGAAFCLYNPRNDILSNNVGLMLKWLDGASCKEVQAALSETLEKTIKNKTTDDCSIALMRKSSFAAAEFVKLPGEMITDLLISEGRQKGFSRNHALILQAHQGGYHTTKDLCRKTELTARTVRRHLHLAASRGYEFNDGRESHGSND